MTEQSNQTRTASLDSLSQETIQGASHRPRLVAAFRLIALWLLVWCGHSFWDIRFPRMYAADHIDHLRWGRAFQEVSPRSGGKSFLDVRIIRKCGENDDSRRGRLCPNRDHGFNATPIRESQVHQRHIGPEVPMVLNGFGSRAGLRHENHIRLILDDRG
jgi:hypothetical protein